MQSTTKCISVYTINGLSHCSRIIPSSVNATEQILLATLRVNGSSRNLRLKVHRFVALIRKSFTNLLKKKKGKNKSLHLRVLVNQPPLSSNLLSNVNAFDSFQRVTVFTSNQIGRLKKSIGNNEACSFVKRSHKGNLSISMPCLLNFVRETPDVRRSTRRWKFEIVFFVEKRNISRRCLPLVEIPSLADLHPPSRRGRVRAND